MEADGWPLPHTVCLICLGLVKTKKLTSRRRGKGVPYRKNRLGQTLVWDCKLSLGAASRRLCCWLIEMQIGEGPETKDECPVTARPSWPPGLAK